MSFLKIVSSELSGERDCEKSTILDSLLKSKGALDAVAAILDIFHNQTQFPFYLNQHFCLKFSSSTASPKFTKSAKT